MDAAICAIVFWIVGYCVAFGDPTSPNANGFMGVDSIVLEGEQWAKWFFEMSFACATCTIVSGAVAERLRLEPYFIGTVAISAWIYPVAAHWIWSESGWLSPTNPGVSVYAGAIDFAGSSVVHMVGGFCGLCGAVIVGPRFRRFEATKDALASAHRDELMHQFEFGHNMPYQVLGLLILWFGFYGFNPGSTMAASNGGMEVASLIAVNTTLSAAAGGIASALLARLMTKSWHIPRLTNGILAALASITGGCAVVTPGWSIFIGIVGSLSYCGASRLLIRLRIDDPLDAFSVHGVGGMWGVLAAALFSDAASLEAAGYPRALFAGTNWGQRLASNVLLVVVVVGWTVLNAVALYGGMSYMGILRVSEAVERSGIDQAEHGGSAVNMNRPYAQMAALNANALAKKTHDKKRYRRAVESDEEDEDGDVASGVSGKVRESSLEKRLGGIQE